MLAALEFGLARSWYWRPSSSPGRGKSDPGPGAGLLGIGGPRSAVAGPSDVEGGRSDGWLCSARVMDRVAMRRSGVSADRNLGHPDDDRSWVSVSTGHGRDAEASSACGAAGGPHTTRLLPLTGAGGWLSAAICVWLLFGPCAAGSTRSRPGLRPGAVVLLRPPTVHHGTPCGRHPVAASTRGSAYAPAATLGETARHGRCCGAAHRGTSPSALPAAGGRRRRRVILVRPAWLVRTGSAASWSASWSTGPGSPQGVRDCSDDK